MGGAWQGSGSSEYCCLLLHILGVSLHFIGNWDCMWPGQQPGTCSSYIYLDVRGSSLSQATAMWVSHCPSAIHEITLTSSKRGQRQVCDCVSATSESSARKQRWLLMDTIPFGSRIGCLAEEGCDALMMITEALLLWQPVLTLCRWLGRNCHTRCDEPAAEAREVELASWATLLIHCPPCLMGRQAWIHTGVDLQKEVLMLLGMILSKLLYHCSTSDRKHGAVFPNCIQPVLMAILYSLIS